MTSRNLIAVLLLVSLGHAWNVAAAAKVCPLPELNNVSYSSVTELPFREPDDTVMYGEDGLQRAELWRASFNPLNKTAPVVALIHGGCWLNAFDIAHTRALSSALADAGYHVWSLEYRRTGDPGGGWPGTLDDILTGLNRLVEDTPAGFDLSRVALLGHSAGGHLALFAATSSQLILAPKVVLGLAPITDLTLYASGDNSCQHATPAFMGSTVEETPERYLQASVAPDSPFTTKITVLHGDLDSIVPLDQSEGFPRRLIQGAGHFDFVHPHTPAFQAILRELAQNL